MTKDNITTIYIYYFQYDPMTYTNDITVTEVKVKETSKQYRCVNINAYPFNCSSILAKDKLDKVMKCYSSYVFYSLNKIDMESFKNIIIDYLESERDNLRKKITELNNIQECFESILNEKY